MRHAVLLPNHHAVRVERARAARDRRVGLTLLTMEHLAARLAGGFLQPIGEEELLEAIPRAISRPLGELETVKCLGGFQRAAAATLRKVWLAGVDLEARALESSRCAELSRLEKAVLAHVPASMLRPLDLAARASERIEHAERLFGRIDVRGFVEVEPVWRPLLRMLAQTLPLTWHAGPRRVPTWVTESGIRVVREEACMPLVRAESCADPRHEALEALRWARELMASGRARPEEIAIAAASPQAWDDYFGALEAATGIGVCHVHGRRVLTTPDGQLVAALAEIVLCGVSRMRMLRLVGLLRRLIPRFESIPSGWQHGLPDDAPLLDLVRWRQALETHALPEEAERALGEIVDVLALGRTRAGEIGERLLKGPKSPSLALWRQALLEGPIDALDGTLQSMRSPDEHEPESSVIWAPAALLASAPRPYVRLLGLTSRAWPRQAQEDPLLPSHVIAAEELDPFPVQQADRCDFESIVAATARELVCSRARRDAEGRGSGMSPLYPREVKERYLRRTRLPEHAASPTDRFFARPDEFADTPIARSALACWNNWHAAEPTPHDGLIRPDHPVVLRALERRQSASSLALLLRDPLGYLWTYGFGWDAPEEAEEPLFLEAQSFGTLLHAVVESAVTALERECPGGFAGASGQTLNAAIEASLRERAQEWEARHPIPPPVLWNCTLDELRELARLALGFAEPPLPEQRSWAEIPFGGVDSRSEVRGDVPWDPLAAVSIPGTDIRIGGVIDRLDLSADGVCARVTDYKAGRPPAKPPIVKQGAELQRCLYAYAVRVLLPEVQSVETRLLYPRALRAERPGLFALEDAACVLESLTAFLTEAKSLVAAGNTLLGVGSDARRACALPAGAEEWYRPLKALGIQERLGRLPELWEMG